MAQDQSVKALVIALTDHAAAAVYSINRLQPDSLCFVLPEGAKSLVESEVQPKIEHMPRRWDWVVLTETNEFVGCYQTLARTLPEMLRTWEVQPGELVVDMTGATPAMAGALTLATMSISSRIVSLVRRERGRMRTGSIYLGSRSYGRRGIRGMRQRLSHVARAASCSTADRLPQRQSCSARSKHG